MNWICYHDTLITFTNGFTSCRLYFVSRLTFFKEPQVAKLQCLHFVRRHKKLRSIANSCQSINFIRDIPLTFRLCYYILCAFCPHICKHDVKYTVTTNFQCIHKHCTIISLMAGIQFVLRTKIIWRVDRLWKGTLVEKWGPTPSLVLLSCWWSYCYQVILLGWVTTIRLSKIRERFYYQAADSMMTDITHCRSKLAVCTTACNTS